MITCNGQSASKLLLNGEGSTTIPKGSTLILRKGKRPVYLKEKYVIYRILNVLDNKFYIGSASQFDKRIGSHVSKLRRNKHWNVYLQASWNKYGEEFFEFEIIEKTDKENIHNREQYWITNTRCFERDIGYNLNKSAYSKIGTKMPETAKKKISDYWLGKPKTKEHAQNIKNGITKLLGKTVLVYNSSMELIAEYPSTQEAARHTNYSFSLIARQCRNCSGGKKFWKPNKLIFRYKDIVCPI
jgi:hypothetical protein